MKKIFSGIVMAAAAVLFVACDINDPNDGRFGSDSQSGFVEFEDPTTIVLSGFTEFKVPVVLDAPVNTDGVTVDYTVAPVDGNIDFLSYSGQVIIPAGSRVGHAIFTMPETPLTSCVQFNITLTGTSRSNVRVGFNDENNHGSITNLVTIGKSRDAFIGTYDVVEDGGASEYVSVISAGEAPNELVITNLVGITPTSETHVFLAPFSGNGTVSFPDFSENLLFTSNNPAQGNVFVSNEFEGLFREVPEVPGVFVPSTFDPCDLTLDLNFFLVFGPAQDTFSPTPVEDEAVSINTVFTKRP